MCAEQFPCHGTATTCPHLCLNKMDLLARYVTHRRLNIVQNLPLKIKRAQYLSNLYIGRWELVILWIAQWQPTLVLLTDVILSYITFQFRLSETCLFIVSSGVVQVSDFRSALCSPEATLLVLSDTIIFMSSGKGEDGQEQDQETETCLEKPLVWLESSHKQNIYNLS